MAAAIADVDQGKPVRSAAKEHGIPLRSLYHKLKMRSTSTQKTLVSLRDKSDFADEEELVTVQFHENLPSSPDADSNWAPLYNPLPRLAPFPPAWKKMKCTQLGLRELGRWGIDVDQLDSSRLSGYNFTLIF